MSDIALNISLLKQQLPPGVKIVAVSKKRSVEEIMTAYNAGHRIFGENRVQELLAKKEKLPSDIEWHLIGHLQSNKVRSLVPFINMIQSVDSLKLLSVIHSEAEKEGRLINCLLQFHIAQEETKSGFNKEEVFDLIGSGELARFSCVRICGVMGMGTFTEKKDQVRLEFRFLKSLFDNLKLKYFSDNVYFREISMGMSGDFELAVEEGSTMVRIGTLIFGPVGR
jgi:pyridoxal phosphate enzyme (YggS family)